MELSVEVSKAKATFMHGGRPLSRLLRNTNHEVFEGRVYVAMFLREDSEVDGRFVYHLLDLLGLVHTLLPVATLPVLNPEAAYIRDFSHRRGGRQSCLHETFLYRECCSYEWSDEPLVVVFAEVDVVFPTCGRASLVLT